MATMSWTHSDIGMTSGTLHVTGSPPSGSWDTTTYTFSGRTPGELTTVSGSIGYTYTTSEGATAHGTSSFSVVVYMHPSEFNWGATKDGSLAEVLTAENAMNHYARATQLQSWYAQANKYGTTTIAKDDPITAAWYNSLVTILNQSGQSVENVQKDDLITADVINALNIPAGS